MTVSIRTNRLLLRQLQSSDARHLYELTDRSRKHLERWLPWVPSVKSVADSLAFIESTVKQYERNDGFHLGIWMDVSLVGVIGLHEIDHQNRSTSIGYWLGEEFQGRGYMSETCRAVCIFLFQTSDLNRIWLRTAVGNIKSQNLAERLGFVREGILRKAELLSAGYVDQCSYSLLRDDFALRRKTLT
jgi:ribosomal-protein-serine acetyltransferase